MTAPAEHPLARAPLEEWDLSGMADRARGARLLSGPDGYEIIRRVVADAELRVPPISVAWKPCDDQKGYSRFEAVVPISLETFDHLWSGPAGYRGQYYVSPTAGAAFNRQLIEVLVPSLAAATALRPLLVDWPTSKASLDGRWSKIWVAGDGSSFAAAPVGEFRPRRWAAISGSTAPALKAPLPPSPAIDIKGTWINDVGVVWVHEAKKTRDCDLHKCGFV